MMITLSRVIIRLSKSPRGCLTCAMAPHLVRRAGCPRARLSPAFPPTCWPRSTPESPAHLRHKGGASLVWQNLAAPPKDPGF